MEGTYVIERLAEVEAMAEVEEAVVGGGLPIPEVEEELELADENDATLLRCSNSSECPDEEGCFGL